MRQKVLWSVAAVLVAAGTLRAADANDVKAELAKRIKMLQNVMVTYDWSNDVSQQGLEERNRQTAGRSFAVAVGAQRQVKLCHLDGKVRYETKEKSPKMMPPAGGTGTMIYQADMASSSVQIVADGTKELLCGYRDNAYFKGFIMDAAGGEDNDVIAGPMGMRAVEKWLDAKVIAACRGANAQNGGVALWFVGDCYSERWSLSPEHGYAPFMQELFRKDGSVESRTDMSDWRKIGDVWIAQKAVKTEFGKGKDGKPIERDKYVFTIKSCEIGSKDNVPALYKMAWPDGTKVTGKDGTMYEASGGELKPVEQK